MHDKDGVSRVIFEIPTRGLLGYRGEFIIDTKEGNYVFSF